MSGVLWFNFLKAWRGDPGIVAANPDIQMRTIVQLAEKGADKGNLSIYFRKIISFVGPGEYPIVPFILLLIIEYIIYFSRQ